MNLKNGTEMDRVDCKGDGGKEPSEIKSVCDGGRMEIGVKKFVLNISLTGENTFEVTMNCQPLFEPFKHRMKLPFASIDHIYVRESDEKKSLKTIILGVPR